MWGIFGVLGEWFAFLRTSVLLFSLYEAICLQARFFSCCRAPGPHIYCFWVHYYLVPRLCPGRNGADLRALDPALGAWNEVQCFELVTGSSTGADPCFTCQGQPYPWRPLSGYVHWNDLDFPKGDIYTLILPGTLQPMHLGGCGAYSRPPLQGVLF